MDTFLGREVRKDEGYTDNDVRDAWGAAHPGSSFGPAPSWVQTILIDEQAVIVNDTKAGKMYRVPFSVSQDGVVRFMESDKQEVRPAWVDKRASGDAFLRGGDVVEKAWSDEARAAARAARGQGGGFKDNAEIEGLGARAGLERHFGYVPDREEAIGHLQATGDYDENDLSGLDKEAAHDELWHQNVKPALLKVKKTWSDEARAAALAARQQSGRRATTGEVDLSGGDAPTRHGYVVGRKNSQGTRYEHPEGHTVIVQRGGGWTYQNPKGENVAGGKDLAGLAGQLSQVHGEPKTGLDELHTPSAGSGELGPERGPDYENDIHGQVRYKPKPKLQGAWKPGRRYGSV
jgi:hypothetical protein